LKQLPKTVIIENNKDTGRLCVIRHDYLNVTFEEPNMKHESSRCFFGLNTQGGKNGKIDDEASGV
jgi:hypothetical protein